MKTHAYNRDPQSGAGNCHCGAAQTHRRHPHEFRRAMSSPPNGSETRCCCALPLSHPIHRQEADQ